VSSDFCFPCCWPVQLNKPLNSLSSKPAPSSLARSGPRVLHPVPETLGFCFWFHSQINASFRPFLCPTPLFAVPQRFWHLCSLSLSPSKSSSGQRPPFHTPAGLFPPQSPTGPTPLQPCFHDEIHVSTAANIPTVQTSPVISQLHISFPYDLPAHCKGLPCKLLLILQYLDF
jgi:hypothetical protein